MKYISKEEFLKQPKEVQEVFIGWWKPSFGDLWYCQERRFEERLGVVNFNTGAIDKYSCTPLFTLQQLIDFIEEKTGGRVEITMGALEGYYCTVKDRDTGDGIMSMHSKVLLKGMWQLTCKVAEECVNNG